MGSSLLPCGTIDSEKNVTPITPRDKMAMMETQADTVLLLRCPCGHETEIPSKQFGVAGRCAECNRKFIASEENTRPAQPDAGATQRARRLAEAERLVHKERYREAGERYGKLLRGHKSIPEAWYGVGYCHYKLGELEKSRRALLNAREMGYEAARALLEHVEKTALQEAGEDPGGEISDEDDFAPSNRDGQTLLLENGVAGNAKSLEQQLRDAVRKLGMCAEKLDVAVGLPEAQHLDERRRARREAAHVLADAEEELEHALESCQKVRRKQEAKLDTLDKKHGPCFQAYHDAKARRAKLEEHVAAAGNEIRNIERQIRETAPESNTHEELRPALDRLHRSFQAARGAFDDADAAFPAIGKRASAGKAEIDEAQDIWARKKARFFERIELARAALAKAKEQLSVAERAKEAALRELGKAIFQAPATHIPELLPELTRVRELNADFELLLPSESGSEAGPQDPSTLLRAAMAAAAVFWFLLCVGIVVAWQLLKT